jgi:hypothetical protein
MHGDRFLRVAALVYLGGLVLHTADHVRRGLDVITPAVLWAGNLSTAIGLVTVGLVLTRHRLGPLVAALTGLPIALGVAAVHLLPEWGALSDPFVDAGHSGVTAWSWAVVVIEIAGALALGLAGAQILAARHRLAG